LDCRRWLLPPDLDSSASFNASNARPFALAQLNTRLLLASMQSRALFAFTKLKENLLGPAERASDLDQ
jgi:hypothetical protein